MNYSPESQDRIAKLEKLRAAGLNPYPDKFHKRESVVKIIDTAEKANKTDFRAPKDIAYSPQPTVKTAGRLVAFRSHGKLNFGQLQDDTARIQICFMEDLLGAKQIEHLELIDVADFIGIEGELFYTNKGELTIMVTQFVLLSKAIRPLPEKWHGLQDQETKYRQRYLDLVSDPETFERFKFRSAFIQKMREFFLQNNFIEVTTPVLVNKASGALAKPFITHHNDLDIDVYLRIATETYLKKAVVGGFERVFEIGPDFRNEGSDPSHLQEFTMCEYYAAYWNFEDSMRFTEEMVIYMLKELLGTLKVNIADREGNIHEVDFTGPWPRVSLRDLIKQDADIDFNDYATADELRAAIEAKNIDLSKVANYKQLGRGNLIDALYKKVSRPKMIQPVFVTSHPVDLSPLARRNDDNPDITDRFQLVVNTWELVNAYSELVDPLDQRQRLEEQASLKADGDEDAMMMDEPFIEAMEHGMPPMSGWGMGIERFLALLTQQSNLRDVVLFPLLRPEQENSTPPEAENKKVEQSTETAANSDQSRLRNHMTSREETLISLGFTRDQAVELVKKYVDPELQPHLFFVEAAMRKLADHYGHADHKDVWGLVGLLHDVDWSITQNDNDPLAHCGTKLDEILGEISASEEFINTIRSHYWEHGVPVDTTLRKALFAVDELTGLIVATTLVRPSKKMDDVKVKSVKKKFKDKGFAAAVDRDLIKSCEEYLDTELSEFIQLTLEAMQEVAGEYGM